MEKLVFYIIEEFMAGHWTCRLSSSYLELLLVIFADESK